MRIFSNKLDQNIMTQFKKTNWNSQKDKIASEYTQQISEIVNSFLNIIDDNINSIYMIRILKSLSEEINNFFMD